MLNKYVTTQFGKAVKVDEDGKYYFYPADLVEVRLVPYKGKLSQLADFEEIREYLDDAYIKMKLREQAGYWSIPCKYHWKEHCLYVTEEKFNAHWKEIRYKLMGFYMTQTSETMMTREKLDEQVDLSLYITPTRDARIVKNRIVTSPKETDPATKLLISKRSSAMDNKKLIYVYHAEMGPVHDKSCEYVKEISHEAFRAAETRPEDRPLCKACRRCLYIRRACGDDFKNYQFYNRFLHKGALSQTTLEIFVDKYHGKMHMEEPNMMRLKCGEDTWKIEMQAMGLLALYHNNYVMVNEEERYITDGFHQQNVTATQLGDLFKYIEKYTWQGHLKAKRSVVEESTGLQEQRMEKQTTDTIIASIQEKAEEKREAWWNRFFKWLKIK